MNVEDKTNFCLVSNFPQLNALSRGVYLEILKRNLLPCYPDGTITSSPRYVDLGGDADVNAALVQHLQYAIPSARPTITGQVWHYIIGHGNLLSFQLMYHFFC